MKNPVLWILHRTAVVITDVSEERIATIIRVTRIGDLGTTLAVTGNRNPLGRNTSCLGQLLFTANVSRSRILVTLMMELIYSYEASVLTRATWRDISEDSILHSHSRGRLRSDN
jgi:hypothetical protein